MDPFRTTKILVNLRSFRLYFPKGTKLFQLLLEEAYFFLVHLGYNLERSRV